MCGIFAYSGNKNATDEVFDGLRHLTYRGYDSWGIGVLENNNIIIQKQIGAVENARVTLENSHLGLGHTRWATHGRVNITNAHPHSSQDKSFIIVHNGIVENFFQIKKQYLSNYKFITQTDTEAIVRLIEYFLKTDHGLLKAVRQTANVIEGRNTFLLLSRNGELIGYKNGSPLIIGKDHKQNEYYVASDTVSLGRKISKIIVMDNQQLFILSNNRLKLFNLQNAQEINKNWKSLSATYEDVTKNNFAHFMLKEIFEQPQVVRNILHQDKKQLHELELIFKHSRTIYTIGSGTAGCAASQMAYYLRNIAGINAISLIGAEAREYVHLFSAKDLIIVLSQSGETADVLEILEPAKKTGIKIISLVNMSGSAIERISHLCFSAQAGPEICVLSTKVFIAQIAWGYLIAKMLNGEYEAGLNNLSKLAKTMELYLQNKQNIKVIKNISRTLSHQKHIFLLGKGQNLSIMQEGMIKIIEGTYIHAHAIPAGDLKHYAITLMEKNIWVIAVISNDVVQKEVMNAIWEVKARGASILAIAPQKSKDFNLYLPSIDTDETSAIFNIVPLQLLAYYTALKLGNNIDRPRNIAKSVTVK